MANPIVLDAAALINLMGTDAADKILAALGRGCLIEERVLAELKYHPIPGRDCTAEIEKLQQLGYVSVASMSDDEYERYLELVVPGGIKGLGAGESASIALASYRHLSIVLDDRKARRVCNELYPMTALTSSTQTFLEAGKNAGWSVGQMKTIFQAAIANASMGILKEERVLVAHLNLNL